MSVVAWCAPRSMEQAAKVAEQFVSESSNAIRKQAGLSTVPAVQLAKEYCQTNGAAALYVFNRCDDGGYVIISADDRTEDVLGYTDSGRFDASKVNPSMQWWLDRYARQVASLSDSISSVRKAEEPTVDAIFPLLGATKWAQETPYYNKCPMDLFTSDTSLTGCVATAAAQIMKKWQYPSHGTGTHSYSWCLTQYLPYREDCKTLSLKYDTITFDWAHMKDSYKKNYTKQEAQAVATLMYACGVACDMEYSSDGSGSFTDDMGYGLITYFDYTYTIFASATSRSEYSYAKGNAGIRLDKYKFSCTTSELEDYLNADLEAGRPVLMGGRDSYSGGHEFVCDGRDSSGKFHINWGWSGDENGYYTLSALGKSYDFSNDIDMLVGLQPSVITAIDEQQATASSAKKWMHQGRLYINHNGVLYDVLGNQL